jgi:DNA (cytosine-5)-methyltransferase 1
MAPLRFGSLCTGYGGLDLAAEAVFDLEPVFHAEVDPAASRVLAHRFPGVPNLGDITALDWNAVPRVDVLGAGYPCQPESLAGNRKGAEDERWIWPAVAAAVRVLRPRIVLLENVYGHLSLGFRTVLGDLAASGFDAEWLVLAASDLGAAHQRKRLFVYAWPADPEGERRGEGPVPARPAGEQGQPCHSSGAADADADGRGLARDAQRYGEPQPGISAPRRHDAVRRAAAASDPARLGEREPADPDHPLAGGRDTRALARGGGLLPTPCATDGVKGGPNQAFGDGRPALSGAVQPDRWGQYAAAIAAHEHLAGRAAPEPTEPGPNGPRLSPRFTEWLMCLPDGHVTDTPGITRADMLRLLGNGVIPPQGATAYAELARRARI